MIGRGEVKWGTTCDQEGENHQGPLNPADRRDSRAASHGRTLKINPSRIPQAIIAGSREIEVSLESQPP